MSEKTGNYDLERFGGGGRSEGIPPLRRLVVVSNRLPVVVSQGQDGRVVTKRGSGGLVTAMEPVLQDRGGVWIGWSGLTEEPPDLDAALKSAGRETGYELRALTLSEQERDEFYHGYANEVLWPLFHDLQGQCNFAPEYEQTYVSVNRRYADLLRASARPNDFIWVHDYHLMHVAQALHEAEFRAHVAFFLHIPFPPLDIFVKLPGRYRLLRALLHYDMLGFQTVGDRRNFVGCVRRLLPSVKVRTHGPMHVIHMPEDRQVRVGTFPIGIDAEDFARTARSDEVTRLTREIRSNIPADQLLLGVDRLDYTKGIPNRLLAYDDALQRYPQMRQKTTFIQVVVPSRADIPKYAALKTEIERLVGEINGRFATGNWVPIHYFFRSLDRPELLAHYRACDVGVITPLKDGMNLVAKEYCVCDVDLNGVLVLSEFAGAVAQLRRGAMLVNPYDVRGTADVIYEACQTGRQERRSRMRRMQRVIRQRDIYWWMNTFLQAAFAIRLDQLPQAEDFVPREEDEKPAASPLEQA